MGRKAWQRGPLIGNALFIVPVYSPKSLGHRDCVKRLRIASLPFPTRLYRADQTNQSLLGFRAVPQSSVKDSELRLVCDATTTEKRDFFSSRQDRLKKKKRRR